MSPSPEAPVRVAYLVSKYPAISHTFIEREIVGLRAAGVEVHTFSVRRCPPEELKSTLMREEAARTRVLIDDVKNVYPRAHAELLRRAPKVWVATLARAMRSGDTTARARVWQVFYFAEAVVLWHHMNALGLLHVHVHFANVSADVARLAVAIGRMVDGPHSAWRWSLTMHGPTEFEAVEKVDLPAKTRDANGIACISDFARSQLMRLVSPEHWGKMQLVRMTVDPEAYTPPADGRSGRTGPLRILDVGRLVPEKGGPVLLEAVARLRDRGVAADVRFVGGGELEETLRRRIREFNLQDSATLVGPVGQDHMLEQYHWADVFCLPSFQEGLPVVLMEALATETPVVTTRIAAVDELVRDGENGRVVAPGRADLLADALEDLAASPAERTRLGAAGRQAVLAEFTSLTATPAMVKMLRDVQRPCS